MILIDKNAGSMVSVEYVFKVLAAAYGAAWERSLGTAPLGDVMTVWANALDGLTQTPQARKRIVWALNNLPDRCPNAMEFRRLCGQAPAPAVPLLPEPAKADPQRVATELSKLRTNTDERRSDPKDWARRIMARHEAGDRMRPITLRFACEALRIQPPQPGVGSRVGGGS